MDMTPEITALVEKAQRLAMEHGRKDWDEGYVDGEKWHRDEYSFRDGGIYIFITKFAESDSSYFARAKGPPSLRLIVYGSEHSRDKGYVLEWCTDGLDSYVSGDWEQKLDAAFNERCSE